MKAVVFLVWWLGVSEFYVRICGVVFARLDCLGSGVVDAGSKLCFEVGGYVVSPGSRKLGVLLSFRVTVWVMSGFCDALISKRRCLKYGGSCGSV